MAQQFVKDPDAVLDYCIDWSSWLATGESINASTWTVTAGITADSDDNSNTDTVVWLSGGIAGNAYEATNHIVTSAGREEDRTLSIFCIER